MSKKAEEAALKAYPKRQDWERNLYKDGYEQAEKETTERAVAILDKMLDDMYYSRQFSQMVKDFREAMEYEQD